MGSRLKQLYMALNPYDFFSMGISFKTTRDNDNLHSGIGLLCSLPIYILVIAYAYLRFDALINFGDQSIKAIIAPKGTPADSVFEYTIGEKDPETGFDFRYAFVLNDNGKWPMDMMRVAGMMMAS